ncbi:MAG TPA: protein kinase [Myxococcaceae bacterium]|nr:protein kinase [Myxococcaceae bacterium]
MVTVSRQSESTPSARTEASAARGEQELPARFGRYVLLSRLGRGGMADVYRAQALGAGGFVKPVVIKRIQPEVLRQQSSVRMFIEEARLSAVLQHQNIVQIFDFGEHQGEYFLAMEWVHGKDLHDLTRRAAERGQGVPLPLACYIAMEVLAGLDSAHRACSATGEPLNLVHRDVNPTNVLLSFEGEVKLTDFGVARVGAGPCEVRGKPGYIPPEQLTRKEPDARGDLFALGITLWELLAGKAPFQGETLEVLKQTVALKHRPLRLAEVAPEVPAALCEVVDRCVRAHPEERYASAAEALDALGDFLQSAGLRVSQRALAAWMASLYTPEERARPVEPPLSVEPPRPVVARTPPPPASPSRPGAPRAAPREPSTPPHLAGELGRVPPVRLLARLMVAKATGKLRFENQRQAKELFFKAGRLVSVRSNLEEDRLGRYLLANGKLSPEQWLRAAGTLTPVSGRLPEALLASRVLTPNELAESLHSHRCAVALGVLRWTSGRFAFHEHELPARDGTEDCLGGLPLLNEGVRAHYTLERLARDQEPLRDTPLLRNPRAPITQDELALSASELRAVSLLKPGGTLGSALSSLRRPEDELPLRRVALLFTEVGLLDAA